MWTSLTEFDLNLLFICRVFKSLFDIPHGNPTQSEFKGSFGQERIN